MTIIDTPDRRVQKTRTALHAAFLTVLFDQGYEALKLGAVARLANVGRSTLYEHYRTKHDLLRASVAAPFTVLADLSTAPAAPAAPAEQGEPAADARLTGLLRHLREQGQVGRMLLSGPNRPLLGRTLAGLIATRWEKALPPIALLIPVEIAARQMADAQLALLEGWIGGRPCCDITAMEQALRRTSRALLVALAPTRP